MHFAAKGIVIAVANTSNFERTTWLSETSETVPSYATSDNH
ncbi:hypothetical protein VAEKB19_3290175 [Vibrio aestuarianus]|nr:hypothetical protein VAEKB19_3290175 [Vibrio aestuarianus]